MSHGAQWGEANYPINEFNPTHLDCNQWADAALNAGMKFGLLTTKHHEGFCLWDSQFTAYDVASTPYGEDIVKQYVDAFRERGLGVGLYYSIWDSTHKIDKGQIDDDKLSFIKGQIRELLSNYGKIDYLVIDGWFWRMGHHEVPYHEIRTLVKSLQPECLITDHTHLQAPYHVDIPYFEGPFGAFPSSNNTMASALGHCSVKGNGWFWSDETPTGMKDNDGLDTIVNKLKQCEQRYCNFMLNCMPNRDGLLDTIYLDLLKDISHNWNPDLSRKPLPNQGALIQQSIPVKQVYASSGNADYLIDATKIPGKNYYTWTSDSIFPQTIVIDLGMVVDDVDVMNIVQKHRCKPAPEKALQEDNITSCELYGSIDNKNWMHLCFFEGEADAQYRNLSFIKSSIRYLKLEIKEVNGTFASIEEIEIGKTLKSDY